MKYFYIKIKYFIFSTEKMSFGWHRAEVVGAMVSVLLIWVVTGILVYLAVLRVISGDFEIDSTVMLITSGVSSVVFNGVDFFKLVSIHTTCFKISTKKQRLKG